MNESRRITMATGVVAVLAGVALIGTTGVTFAIGWGLWLVGLVAVLGTVGRPVTASAPVTRITLEPAGVGERQAA